ncbi:uncharacterized protein GIQ15_00416 [Arthroderma uncinatum]|uniref:uncharacterized protein n=1 Tax=Arthroderma uncinatum TaxID=74035 RepID=UPI00144A8577|nr:uncharacterized protein GIQ15_00416 [Arthroderma uncinatum]KAF3490899.1 hypothetical protein GIQ15_00416 [Arthroderma uncinatum]
MGIAMVSGLSTSMLLETVLLRMGRDQLPWKAAAKTAAGMSLVSMLGMETVQNLVDYHLTSGVVAFDDPSFWMAAAASAAAGYLAPLPYNYTRLRKPEKPAATNFTRFFPLLLRQFHDRRCCEERRQESLLPARHRFSLPLRLSGPLTSPTAPLPMLVSSSTTILQPIARAL